MGLRPGEYGAAPVAGAACAVCGKPLAHRIDAKTCGSSSCRTARWRKRAKRAVVNAGITSSPVTTTTTSEPNNSPTTNVTDDSPVTPNAPTISPATTSVTTTQVTPRTPRRPPDLGLVLARLLRAGPVALAHLDGLVGSPAALCLGLELVEDGFARLYVRQAGAVLEAV